MVNAPEGPVGSRFPEDPHVPPADSPSHGTSRLCTRTPATATGHRPHCPHAARPGRRFGHDRRGNVQVVEAMIVAGLVGTAIFMVSTFDVPVAETEGYKANHEQLVEDSLQALYHRPSTYNNGQTFGSLLEQHVLESLAGDNKNLAAYLNKSLPAGAQYNVFLDTGYGKPHHLIYQGEPPREAVAHTFPFVPRLAYTFMQPAFAYYHGDFPMGIYAIPVHHGLLARDEGEAVEVAVTYTEDNSGDSFTLKSYGQTAHRQNLDSVRSWPSVTLMINDTTPSFYVDASSVPLYEERIEGVGRDAYSIDFQIALNETAGQVVPRGTEIRLEFPRLWSFNATKQAELEADATNAATWTSFSFDGSVYAGTVIKARLKDDIPANGTFEFNLTGNYVGLLDTAYPYFSQIHTSLGSGVQGQAFFIIELPSILSKAGILSRDVWLSIPKPMIGDLRTDWGIAFTNTGEDLTIGSITVNQPESVALFTDIDHKAGSMSGTWSRQSASHYTWVPSAGQGAIAQGEAGWIHLDVDAAASTDNDYRNANYLQMDYQFSSLNTTGTNNLEAFNYTRSVYRMNPAWGYFERTQPYDEDGAFGWPDEVGNQYWARATGYHQNRQLMGNATYDVMPVGLTSNTFGEYRGAASNAEVVLMGQSGESSSYGHGENVYIKNNFTALFTSLGSLDGLGGIEIGDDVDIVTKVYTPERAWKGSGAATYRETVNTLSTVLGSITHVAAVDLDGDGSQDVVIADSNGLVHALDGRDGSRYWTYTAPGDVVAMEIGDIDGDGQPDAVLGLDGGVLIAVDTTPSGIPSAARLKWTLTLSGTTIGIKDLVLVGDGQTGRPDIAVSVTSGLMDPVIKGVDAISTSKAVERGNHTVSNGDDDHVASGMPDLEPIIQGGGMWPTHVAVSSNNGTVVLLDVDDWSVTWATRFHGSVGMMASGNLDADDYPEIFVASDGREQYVIDGKTGRYGAQVRLSDGLAGWTGSVGVYYPVDSAQLPGGTSIVVDMSPLIIADHTSLSKPISGLPVTSVELSAFDTYAELVGVAPAEFTKEWAAVQVIGDVAYITGRDGEIRANTTEINNGKIIWESVQDPFGNYAEAVVYDSHLDEDFPDGGIAYTLDDHGMINATGGSHGSSWVELGSVCADAPIQCSATDSYIWKWAVDDGGDGKADVFYILARVNVTGAAETFLVSYHTASDTWTKESKWTERKYAIERTASGKFYVLGSDVSIIEASDAAGPWTSHTVQGAKPGGSGTPTDLHMDDSGTGWAITTANMAYKYMGNREWQTVHSDLEGATTFSSIMMDGDGTAWVWGDGYTYVPLTAYNATAEARYDIDLSGTGGADPNRLEIEAVESSYGGDGVSDTKTFVHWQYRLGPSYAWSPVGVTPSAQERGFATHTRWAPITCALVGCDDLEVRAVLSNRAYDDGAGNFASDHGASPTVESAIIRLWDGATELDNYTLDLSAPTWSTARYSNAYAALTLPEVDGLFGLRDNATDASRNLAIIDEDLDGNGGGELVRGSSDGMFVFSGSDGRLLAKASAWGTEPAYIRSFDLTGDGVDDIIGSFTNGQVSAWNVSAGSFTNYIVPGLDSSLADIVDTSRSATNRSFATGGAESTVYLVQDDTSNGFSPGLFWSTSTSEAQGKLTFQYKVPENALFGLNFVVSEMSWQMTEGGTTITQTARIIDWFEVTPKNRPLPRPPIYEVEIVSWFNEL